MTNTVKGMNAAISGLAFVAAVLASPAAQAQGTAAPGTPTAADNSADTSGDIVVTAQRRSESLQDVPISVQAFSQETLSTGGIRAIQDLQLVTPGLVSGRNAGGATPFIRGIGTGAAAAGTEQAVATYVDGVYRQSGYSNNLPFIDIERVEVLKGPQGTLFGRNTTGGLIHIITRDPQQDPSAQFEVGYGSYQTFDANAYVTGGLAPNLAASATGYIRRQSRGFGRNVVTGNRVMSYDELATRAKIKYDDGDTRITLSGDYADVADPRGFIRGIPKGTFAGGPNNITGTYLGFRNVAANIIPHSKSIDFGGSITAEHDFTGFQVVSVTAWRNSNTRISQWDNDFTAGDLLRAQAQFIDRNFTQELRIASTATEGISWIAGIFYLDGHSIADVRVPTILRSHLYTKSYSAFAEVGIPLFGDGTLTLGGRYTVDERNIRGVVGVNPVAPADPDHTWKEPTWRVVYSYNINPDLMAYASYNRGYKSGNYNVTPATSPAYNPEILDAFEVGYKATLFDRRVHWNTSAFYYLYKDLQLNVFTGTATFTINAAKATIWGLESEVDARIAGGLSFNLGGSYTHGNYKNFPGAQVWVPNRNAAGVLIGGNANAAIDASGNQLVRAPRFTASAGITYTTELAGGDVTATVRGLYSSSFPWEASGRLRQRGYGVLNASLGYEAQAGWGIRVEGKNITGTNYVTFSNSSGAGDYYVPADPATFRIVASLKL